MAIALNEPLTGGFSEGIPLAAWQTLLSNIRAFNPDIVILVARKMPRLAERFGFQMSPRILVVSDLAIPFIHVLLAGARVAVVDDIVNVGSTLRRACQSVIACGAAVVKAFALGARDAAVCQSEGIDCVWNESLDAAQYSTWTEAVPVALHALAKPYDLEFPVIRCRVNPPLRDAADVMRWLTQRFGRESVHPVGLPAEAGRAARITVDVARGSSGVNKLRLYFDAKKPACNLVPFAIPPVLDRDSLGMPTHPFSKSLLAAILRLLVGCPAGVSLWQGEAYARALLFSRSLDLGMRQLDVLDDLLTLTDDVPISIPDATLVFGPLDLCTSTTCDLPSLDSELLPRAEQPATSSSSPFIDVIRGSSSSGILARIRKCASGTNGFTIFAGFFDELAASVGASNPAQYSLLWPYSHEEIQATPYLRLRIGPTFEDLVCLYEMLLPEAEQRWGVPVRGQVSALLDQAIDEGAVVPTITRYGHSYYRIYRKGESEARDRATDRALFAWQMYGKPLSLTRSSKINTILAFSAELPQILVPDALTRGNAASLQATVLDLEDAEVAHYLLHTGRLEAREK